MLGASFIFRILTTCTAAGIAGAWLVDALLAQEHGAINPSRSIQSVATYEQLRTVNESALHEPEAAATFDPGWWRPMVIQPLRSDTHSLRLSLDQVLVSALEHSNQIKVFSELPLIRETAIIEADAAFDWYSFLDSRWDDTSEPVGNSLTTGPGIQRFQDHNIAVSGGVRRRTLTGGKFEVAQRFGFQDNNSTYFVPDPQGTARLSLSFTQPLMRGRGRHYNTSLTVLAQIDKGVADDEFRRQLEAHLLEVSRAYWALYLERAVLYQKINSFVRGKQVFDRLQKRRDIDAPVNQIVSAEATLKQRHSELMRARAAVKNAESRLRSLTSDPTYSDAEIIPIDMPSFEIVPFHLGESISLALQHRPEVSQAVKHVEAACVRLDMSKHELLPVLNLVTEAYVAGLQDRGDALGAWERQFATGQPGYSVGLQFEIPFQNRTAHAQHQRRRLELRQLESQYRTTLETIRLEVEVAIRELQTSQKELHTKYQALAARNMQLDALSKRWERLPGVDLTTSLALENLLIAQAHLERAEFEYLQSQLTYNLAMVNLKRATGLLLQHEQVDIGLECRCALPTYGLTKPVLGNVDRETFNSRIRRIPPVVTDEELPLPRP